MAENELIFEISGDCLQAVFGEYDSNILKLEAAFGTSIVNRGDNVKVEILTTAEKQKRSSAL